MAANPYVGAHREWDERYADLVLGKRNWQIAAGGLLALGATPFRWTVLGLRLDFLLAESFRN